MSRRTGSLTIRSTHDDMANVWGMEFVEQSRYGSVTRSVFDSEIRTTIPGFRFFDCVDCGSTANEKAIGLITNSKGGEACLFAIGSYVAGTGDLQNYASSLFLTDNKRLSLIRSPEACNSIAQKQAVALPYHIPYDGFDDNFLQETEQRCLNALEEKITIGLLTGRRYKAFLMEYILSGCGGELTTRFLQNLGELLSQYKIWVVADEVMTGGRVGPKFAMTTSMPKSFVERIKFITLGKIFGCGVMLVDARDTEIPEPRGGTTEICLNEAYWKLTTINKRIQQGVILSKRKLVLERLGLRGNQHWGKGLLMFSSKSRPNVQGNTWNRLLPRLEDSRKTILVKGCTASKYDRVEVNSHIALQVKSWLDYMPTVYDMQFISPYTQELAKFITTRHSKVFHPSELVEVLDASEADMMAKHRALKRQKLGNTDGRCSATHQSLVFWAAKDAKKNSNGFLSSVLKTRKRTKMYVVNFDAIN